MGKRNGEERGNHFNQRKAPLKLHYPPASRVWWAVHAAVRGSGSMFYESTGFSACPLRSAYSLETLTDMKNPIFAGLQNPICPCSRQCRQFSTAQAD